jgi:hypothetical protein
MSKGCTIEYKPTVLNTHDIHKNIWQRQLHKIKIENLDRQISQKQAKKLHKSDIFFNNWYFLTNFILFNLWSENSSIYNQIVFFSKILAHQCWDRLRIHSNLERCFCLLEYFNTVPVLLEHLLLWIRYLIYILTPYFLKGLIIEI